MAIAQVVGGRIKCGHSQDFVFQSFAVGYGEKRFEKACKRIMEYISKAQ